MGVPVTPAELAAQPENLPEPAYLERVGASIANFVQQWGVTPIQQLIGYFSHRGDASKRETPPGGFDVYRLQGYKPEDVRWRYGKPPLNWQSPTPGAPADYGSDDPRKLPWEERLALATVQVPSFPKPSEVLNVKGWPKDLTVTEWVRANLHRATEDPEWRARLLGPMIEAANRPPTTFGQAFAPAVNVFGSAFAGAAGSYFGGTTGDIVSGVLQQAVEIGPAGIESAIARWTRNPRAILADAWAWGRGQIESMLDETGVAALRSLELEKLLEGDTKAWASSVISSAESQIGLPRLQSLLPTSQLSAALSTLPSKLRNKLA